MPSFLVIINDLGLMGVILLFADDTAIYTSGPSTEEAQVLAVEVLSHLKDWFVCNKLSINEEKAHVCVALSAHIQIHWMTSF